MVPAIMLSMDDFAAIASTGMFGLRKRVTIVKRSSAAQSSLVAQRAAGGA